MKLPALALAVLVAAPAPAADPAPVGQRIDRIERELRAVQRKVFPGGAPAFSEPEIAAPEAAPAATATAPGALNDLATRVDGLERELSRLTNQLEQDEHRLSVLSEQTARDRAEFDARLKAIEPAAGAPATAALPPAAESPAPPAPRPRRSKPAAAAADKADAATPAVDKPSTGDPAEDGYLAGYKLWQAKRYDDAEAALAKVAKQYPKNRRASYARNLLGRSQLDSGKPATAAQTLLGNYQADPKGERAPESLFYLGQALTQLKKGDNACRAYDELQQVYGSTMTASLKTRLPVARKAAGCS